MWWWSPMKLEASKRRNNRRFRSSRWRDRQRLPFGRENATEVVGRKPWIIGQKSSEFGQDKSLEIIARPPLRQQSPADLLHGLVAQFVGAASESSFIQAKELRGLALTHPVPPAQPQQ